MRTLIFGSFLILFLCSVKTKSMTIGHVETENKNVQITWLRHMKMWRQQIKDCLKEKEANPWNCLKIGSLQVFQTILDTDVITLYDGVRLVKKSSNTSLATSLQNRRQDLPSTDWWHATSSIVARTLDTHLLELNFEELSKKIMLNVDSTSRGRHRRQRYNMMMTMMFGVTALGAVLVPVGFQLLSIVSGKALLLAKMALLLASINGLKRVANSGIHYGLYHVPSEQLGGYYERGDLHHPRTVLSSNLVNMDGNMLGL